MLTISLRANRVYCIVSPLAVQINRSEKLNLQISKMGNYSELTLLWDKFIDEACFLFHNWRGVGSSPHPSRESGNAFNFMYWKTEYLPRTVTGKIHAKENVVEQWPRQRKFWLRDCNSDGIWEYLIDTFQGSVMPCVVYTICKVITLKRYLPCI